MNLFRNELKQIYKKNVLDCSIIRLNKELELVVVVVVTGSGYRWCVDSYSLRVNVELEVVVVVTGSVLAVIV